MRLKYLFLFLILGPFKFTASAQKEFSIQGIPIGDSLMESGELERAIVEYRNEYMNDIHQPLAAYNLAAAFSMNRQIDSAFKYLFLHIEIDTTIKACTDPYFLPLKKDKRWPEFEDKAIAEVLMARPNAIKDIPLAKKYWEMMALDQAYYYEIDIIEKKIGMNSPVEAALWEEKEKIIEKNVFTLDSIVNLKGWPKISELGHYAGSAAFLIVQHGDLERQKKYLPLIEKLCQDTEAAWSDYALMYDRIQVSENQPQLYGSQLHYNDLTKQYDLYPIEDEKNVDKRRAAMDLEPLEDYVSQWGIIYVPK
ncbi:hypothetical protein BH09BAC5_BH09BAC5_28780 [soil metagenome]